MKLIRLLAVILATGLAGTSAHAVTIDFTDATEWAGIGGLSFDALGLRVESVGAAGGSLTFNAIPAMDFGCSGHGLACDGDGIGIADDEVTGNAQELLRITFLNGPVDILGVDVLDLFQEEGPDSMDESVELSIDGTTYTPFFADAAFSDGYLSTGFTATGVTELYLKGSNDAVSDVALARLEYAQPIPEPATVSLLLAGLVGLGASRRRRRG